MKFFNRFFKKAEAHVKPNWAETERLRLLVKKLDRLANTAADNQYINICKDDLLLLITEYRYRHFDILLHMDVALLYNGTFMRHRYDTTESEILNEQR